MFKALKGALQQKEMDLLSQKDQTKQIGGFLLRSLVAGIGEEALRTTKVYIKGETLELLTSSKATASEISLRLPELLEAYPEIKKRFREVVVR